jgi:hypothetical protein
VYDLLPMPKDLKEFLIIDVLILMWREFFCKQDYHRLYVTLLPATKVIVVKHFSISFHVFSVMSRREIVTSWMSIY